VVDGVLVGEEFSERIQRQNQLGGGRGTMHPNGRASIMSEAR
jgi:hypothetical protein